MKFDPKQPFNLPSLPPASKIETEEILRLLNRANKELASLKGYCLNLPNPMVLMSVALAKESAESSQIENINTTVKGVLEGQVLPQSEIRPEDKEGMNYRRALTWAFENVAQLSLSSRLILGIHEQLMPGSEGYRRQQNSIADTTRDTVIYTPPIASSLNGLLKNWEDFSNGVVPNDLDPLIRCVIAHYQFEAIHPFSDGNGRAGRILLVLHMVTENLLGYPVLFMSGYINRRKTVYYSTLLEVSKTGNWFPFIRFMLEGVEIQSKKTNQNLFEMMQAKEELEGLLRSEHPKMNAADVANHLFANPVTTPTDFANSLGMHYQTAGKYLKEMKESGFLLDTTVGRNHLYSYKRVLEMIRQRD